VFDCRKRGPAGISLHSLTKGGAETFQDPALHIQQVAGFVRQRPRYDWRSAFLVPAVESVGHAISRRPVERVHLRLFHRWRDRRTVWGSSSLVGRPNGLQLFNELVCVGLGFPPCCKGIERCVSHLHVLGNAPSIAASCARSIVKTSAHFPVALWRREALAVTVTPSVARCVARSARSYFAALRMAAQACDTPESAALLPGIVAHPPFSTYAACCHESVFFNSVRLLAASVLCWN